MDLVPAAESVWRDELGTPYHLTPVGKLPSAFGPYKAHDGLRVRPPDR
jgi:hypothetical protein